MQFILPGYSFRLLLSFLFVGFSYEYRHFYIFVIIIFVIYAMENLEKSVLDDFFPLSYTMVYLSTIL